MNDFFNEIPKGNAILKTRGANKLHVEIQDPLHSYLSMCWIVKFRFK